MIEVKDRMSSCMRFCPYILVPDEDPPVPQKNISVAEFEKSLDSFTATLYYGVCEDCTPHIGVIILWIVVLVLMLVWTFNRAKAWMSDDTESMQNSKVDDD